jgi:hypothetical protein
MANVRTLSVSLKARTSGFQRNMKQAKRSVRQFSATVTSASRKAALFGAGLGTAAAAGLTLLTKRSFGSIDSLAKMSDRLNIATESLAGLHLAAKLGGASIGAMDKGLTKFARSIGEAQSGTGEALPIFKDLKLSADELATLPLEKALDKTVDALNGMANATLKADAAAKLFGRSGVDLLNTFAQGSKGLAEITRRTKAYGTAISRVDASLVEDANDAITELKEATIGLGDAIAVNVAPHVTGFARAFGEAATAAEGTRSVVNSVFEDIEINSIRAVAAIESIRTELSLFKAAAQDLLVKRPASFLSTLGTFTKAMLTNAAKMMGVPNIGFGVKVEKGGSKPDLLAGIAAATQEEIDESLGKAAKSMKGDATQAVRDYYQGIRDEAAEAAKAQKDLTKSVREGNAGFGEGLANLKRFARQVFKTTRSPFEKFQDYALKLTEAFREDLVSLDTFLRGLKQAEEGFAKTSMRAAAVGQGAEFHPGREILGLPGRSSMNVQAVRDPQLSTTNTLLKSIETNTMGGQPAVTS